MRLLLDANLSPTIAASLAQAGYDAVHVADLDLLRASDEEILERATTQDFVVVTADSDFPMLLALARADRPSVVLLRHISELSPTQHCELLVANLPAVADDLDRGAIVSLSPTRLAVRSLPVG